MRYSNPNMLVYIAMADAYAVAVEHNRTLEEKCLEFKEYLAHPKHGLPASSYTDDTEMSVGNTQVLLRYDEPFNQLMFADGYVTEFQRGGRRKGYSRGFQGVLEQARTGKELLALIDPISVKNGAAMRAVPIGVLTTREKVLEVATLQASVTHDTPEGRFSARAVALMNHIALYENISPPGLGQHCQWYLPAEDKYFSHVLTQPWPGGPVEASPGTSVAIATVQAVATVLAQENSLMGILRQVIKWGGDTDSVAAIAWGIASVRYQDEKLPSFMERDLEGGNKNERDRLRELGTLLMNKYQ